MFDPHFFEKLHTTQQAFANFIRMQDEARQNYVMTVNTAHIRHISASPGIEFHREKDEQGRDLVRVHCNPESAETTQDGPVWRLYVTYTGSKHCDTFSYSNPEHCAADTASLCANIDPVLLRTFDLRYDQSQVILNRLRIATCAIKKDANNFRLYVQFEDGYQHFFTGFDRVDAESDFERCNSGEEITVLPGETSVDTFVAMQGSFEETADVGV